MEVGNQRRDCILSCYVLSPGCSAPPPFNSKEVLLFALDQQFAPSEGENWWFGTSSLTRRFRSNISTTQQVLCFCSTGHFISEAPRQIQAEVRAQCKKGKWKLLLWANLKCWSYPTKERQTTHILPKRYMELFLF